MEKSAPEKSAPEKTDKKTRQRYFVSMELQINIALLVVLALLGGTFLQSISSILSSFFGFTTTVITIFLAIGYSTIIAMLAIIFSHRLVGPFKRLEHQMKTIASGELDGRLNIRTKDDLHIRNFVKFVNEFIENFENMSKDYSKVHSNLSVQLSDMAKKLEQGQGNPEEIKEALNTLQKNIHELREKW